MRLICTVHAVFHRLFFCNIFGFWVCLVILKYTVISKLILQKCLLILNQEWPGIRPECQLYSILFCVIFLLPSGTLRIAHLPVICGCPVTVWQTLQYVYSLTVLPIRAWRPATSWQSAGGRHHVNDMMSSGKHCVFTVCLVSQSDPTPLLCPY